MTGDSIFRPVWPAPARVHAASTTRVGGVSGPPWNSFNLGHHCGDRDEDVRENRQRLSDTLNLPVRPHWLEQTHSDTVLELTRPGGDCNADATFTHRPGAVLAVLTADCLPVLLCDRAGGRIAAVHAGWRGLAAGIIANTVKRMAPVSELLAWIGPGIGAAAYEVGEDVYSALADADAGLTAHLRPARKGHWMADLAGIAREQLNRLGVGGVFASQSCTYSEPDRFFSHRRDGTTGRMATLIWLKA